MLKSHTRNHSGKHKVQKTTKKKLHNAKRNNNQLMTTTTTTTTATPSPALSHLQRRKFSTAQQTPQQQQQDAAQQQQQQQEMPQIDFTDPQWISRINVYNAWTRQKFAPIFQSNFALALAGAGVIPFPTAEDFKAGLGAFIANGLKKHAIIRDVDDDRKLPDNIANANPKDAEQLKLDLSMFLEMMEFYRVGVEIDEKNSTPDEPKLNHKVGLINPFIPFKSGTFATDPLDFDKAAVDRKLAASARLGMNIANNTTNVFNVVNECFRLAGGADFLKLIVTAEDETTHQHFLHNINKILPEGDLLQSTYHNGITLFNPQDPFCQKQLQTEQVLWNQMQTKKDPVELFRFLQSVYREDITTNWKRENKENVKTLEKLSTIELNPLNADKFTPDELDQIRSLIIKSFIQTALYYEYQLGPFQRFATSLNMPHLVQKQEDLHAFIKNHDEGVYGDKIAEWVQMDTPTLQQLNQLTQTNLYMNAVMLGKHNIAPRSVPIDERKPKQRDFMMKLPQLQLIPPPTKEQIAEVQQKYPGDNDKIMDFFNDHFLHHMVERKVLKKLTPEDMNDPVAQFGDKITDDGLLWTDEETGKEVMIRCYETDILKHFKKFGILSPHDIKNKKYALTTLTPFVNPHDEAELTALKEKIIKNKLLPVNEENLILPPSEESVVEKLKAGEKVAPYKIPYQHQLLFLCMQTNAQGETPDLTVPDIVSDEEKAAVVANGDGEVVAEITNEIPISQMTHQVREIHRSIIKPTHPALPINMESFTLDSDEKAASLGPVLPTVLAELKPLNSVGILRRIVLENFQHDIVLDWAFDNWPLFLSFTRDMHTIGLKEEQLQQVKYLISRLYTQKQLKNIFRVEQGKMLSELNQDTTEWLGAERLPQQPLYRTVVLQTNEEREASFNYFAEKMKM